MSVGPGVLTIQQIRKQRQQRKSNAGLPGQPMPVFVEPSIVPADALDPNLLTPAVWKELVRSLQDPVSCTRLIYWLVRHIPTTLLCRPPLYSPSNLPQASSPGELPISGSTIPTLYKYSRSSSSTSSTHRILVGLLRLDFPLPPYTCCPPFTTECQSS
jgi:hypothetical protein